MRQTMKESYEVKLARGGQAKSFDALKDAVDYINAGMKKRESETFILYNEDKEMIWLDFYRDEEYNGVGYTVARQEDKESVEFDKQKGLLIKNNVKDDEATRAMVVKETGRMKYYREASKLAKFRFVVDKSKPTYIDFEDNCVHYNEGEQLQKNIEELVKQLKAKNESVSKKLNEVHVEYNTDTTPGTKYTAVPYLKKFREVLAKGDFKEPDDVFEAAYDMKIKDVAPRFYRELFNFIVDSPIEQPCIENIQEVFLKKIDDILKRFSSTNESAEPMTEIFGFGKKNKKINKYAVGISSSNRSTYSVDINELARLIKGILNKYATDIRLERYFQYATFESWTFSCTEQDYRNIKDEVGSILPSEVAWPGVDISYDYLENIILWSDDPLEESLDNLVENWYRQSW